MSILGVPVPEKPSPSFRAGRTGSGRQSREALPLTNYYEVRGGINEAGLARTAHLLTFDPIYAS